MRRTYRLGVFGLCTHGDIVWHRCKVYVSALPPSFVTDEPRAAQEVGGLRQIDPTHGISSLGGWSMIAFGRAVAFAQASHIDGVCGQRTGSGSPIRESRPGARWPPRGDSVSPDRFPNPACTFQCTGLSTRPVQAAVCSSLVSGQGEGMTVPR